MHPAQSKFAPTRFRFPSEWPVDGCSPVLGWTLHAFDHDDSDGFTRRAYFARSEKRDVLLDVSLYHFAPTQERFAWLARNGFPSRRGVGPWSDADIDARIALEREAA